MSRKRTRENFLTRLVRPIKRLVVGQGHAAAGQPTNRTVQQTEDGGRPTDDSFRLAIDTLCTDEAGKFQTKLQIISLVEFREAVGDKWHRVADKVMMIAEGVINAHLGAGNIAARQGQDFFTLLFRTCPQPEGRRRALTIAQELGTRLVGDQFIGLERPLALAAEISVADALNPDGSFNFAAFHDAVGEIRALVADAVEAGGPPVRHSMLPGQRIEEERGLRRHMQPGELRAADDPGIRYSMLPGDLPPPPPLPIPAGLLPGRGGPGGEEEVVDLGPDPGWKELEAGPRRPKNEPQWQAMQETSPRPAADAIAPPPAARINIRLPEPVDSAAPPLLSSAEVSVLWRPTWLAGAEAIAAYKAQVQRSDNPGDQVLEGCRAYPPGGGPSAVNLDRAVAAAAVRELTAPEAAANRFTVIVPLHWASMSSAQRMSITAPFSQIGEGIRQSRTIVELFGVPETASTRDLADTVRAARAICREVVLRVRFSAPRLALAMDVGASMVGIDLAELEPSERTDDPTLITALMRFRQEVGKTRLGCYVSGIRRRGVIVAAVRCGFSMINGPALMKDLGRPAKVLPAPKSRFIDKTG